MSTDLDKLKLKWLSTSRWAENEAVYMGNYREYRNYP